jgi:hypothetical protein
MTSVAQMASAQPQQAQPAMAPGAARTLGEAPGGTALAGATEPSAASATPQTGERDEPASDRSMTFQTNTGECRETVPGGMLLAVAYAFAIALMGAYVAFLAWKNNQLVRSVENLEDQLARKTGSAK